MDKSDVKKTIKKPFHAKNLVYECTLFNQAILSYEVQQMYSSSQENTSKLQN